MYKTENTRLTVCVTVVILVDWFPEAHNCTHRSRGSYWAQRRPNCI